MSIWGPILSGALGFLGAERTNSANQAASREQMDFQERMSNTAYQRAVGDLSKAGLNPMLAYGNPASAPQGASYQAQDSVERGTAGSARSIEMELMKEKVATEKESQRLLEAQAMQARAAAYANLHGQEEQLARIAQLSSATDLSAIESRLKGHQEPFARSLAQATSAKAQADVGLVLELTNKAVQDIETGKASQEQLEAMAANLRQITRNLNLDEAEKRAMSQMWKDLGETGATAKTLMPILLMVKSLLGK